MSLYGMDANINQTDGLQQAFASRVAGISDRNQDILSKWQDGQRTKIEEDTVKQYGDQAIGVGETVQQLASAGGSAKRYLDLQKQKVGDKIEQGNRKRRNRKRKIRKDKGEEGVSTDEDEGEIERDDAGNEVAKPRVNAPENERTDDPEGEGEGQHNTGGADENPEAQATDTGEGEGSGGAPDEPQAVQSEAPTDNGESGGQAPAEEPAPAPASAPAEEPAPAPVEEPAPVEQTSLGGDTDDAGRIGASGEPSSGGAPIEDVGSTLESAGEGSGVSGGFSGARLPARLEMGADISRSSVRAGLSRAQSRLAYLSGNPIPDEIDAHVAQQSSEAVSSRVGRLGGSAREAVGGALRKSRVAFDPVASLAEQRASLVSAQADTGDAISQRISSGALDTATADAGETAGRVAGDVSDTVASAGETAGRVAGQVGDAVSSATETGTSLLGRAGSAFQSATETAGKIADQVKSGDIGGATKTGKLLTDDADDIFKTGADFDQGGKFAGAGAKLAGGATKLAGGLLKYGGAVAGVASLGEGIYGEVEAGGKEGDDTTQRVANWASTASSGLETVGTVLDFAGAPEVGVVLNIAGAVVGVGATVVDDIDSWFHDKKKKEDDQKQLQNQKEKGLAGVQGNPTYQNVGGAGETAGLSQSAVRVGG